MVDLLDDPHEGDEIIGLDAIELTAIALWLGALRAKNQDTVDPGARAATFRELPAAVQLQFKAEGSSLLDSVLHEGQAALLASRAPSKKVVLS